MSNKCLECSKKYHCCKNGFAFVGIQDAQKIKKATGKEYNEFLDYSPLSKPVLHVLRKGDPSLENSLRHSLIKDEKILRLKQNKGDCVFLKEGKCSIYEVRPKICRIYPYWCIKLLNGRVKVIEHSRYSLCLIRNLGALTEDEQKNKKKLFNDIHKEAEYYKKNITEFVAKNNL